jgi:hypothetical protein
VQRKKFHLRATSLTADQVNLGQIGLAIYDTGDIVATGRLAHDGGPNGDLRANFVRVHLRAYAGLPNRADAAGLTDAPVVWACEHRFWVKRGRPKTVSLVPPTASQSSQLRCHFEKITHLEVELQCQRDR